jgi:hypothetical protein
MIVSRRKLLYSISYIFNFNIYDIYEKNYITYKIIPINHRALRLRNESGQEAWVSLEDEAGRERVIIFHDG